MEKQILQVLRFHKTFVGTEPPTKPTLPSEEMRLFRQSLLDEEVTELDQATTIEDYADGIIDSIYVLIGTAIEAGMGDRIIELFNEVHASNMSKITLEGEVIKNEQGKVMKPECYFKPDLKGILEKDLEQFLEYSEVAVRIEKEEYEMLGRLVQMNIKKRLNKQDQAEWNSFNRMDKKLNKKIEISYAGGGIDERYAIVRVYGQEEIVKINWNKEVKQAKKKENESK